MILTLPIHLLALLEFVLAQRAVVKWRREISLFLHLKALLEPWLRQDDSKSMNSCRQLAIPLIIFSD